MAAKVKKVKRKSHKGVSKRFKRTKGGKGIVMALGRSFTSHIATHKTRKQKRQLRKQIKLAKGDGYRMAAMMSKKK